MGYQAHGLFVYGIDLGFREDCKLVDPACPDVEASDEYVKWAEVVSGASLIPYGHHEDESLLLGFQVKMTDDWGCSQVSPFVRPSWDGKVKRLAEMLGVDISNKTIGWHVATYYF